MNRRLLLGLLGALALVGLGVVIERLIVTDEERVEAAYAALRAAVQEESEPALAALLTPDFSFTGPPPIGAGTRDTVLPRFVELWGLADGIGLLPRGTREITVVGALATLRTPQIVRFTIGDQFIAYRLDVVLTFDRAGEGWALAQIEVTDLRPGLL
jgi:hypothetical protein